LTTPPRKPGNASRVALAARLAELRAATGLSGNAFAARMGSYQTRIWKIEHNELQPTEDDIRSWVQAAAAGDEVLGELLQLLADARTEQAFGVTLRRKGGPAAYQDRVRAIEGQSGRIGEFQVAVIPGLIQTAAYARELVSLPAGLRTWGADAAEIDAAVDARLRRQEILHDRSKRIQMVITEAALRTLVVTPETLAGQLDKLLSVMWLPSLELGVIGFGQRVPAYTIGGFRVYDEDLIVVESIAGEREFSRDTDPAEVAAFLEAFAELRRAASTGAAAEAIIRRALDQM